MRPSQPSTHPGGGHPLVGTRAHGCCVSTRQRKARGRYAHGLGWGFREPLPPPFHETMPIHGRGCGGPPGRRTLGTGWCRRGRSHAASAEKARGGNRLVVWKRTVTGIDPPPRQRSQCHGSVSSTRRDGFLDVTTPPPRKLHSTESPWLPSGSAGGARKRTKKCKKSKGVNPQ